MNRGEQWMAWICLGILLIALGALLLVKMGEESPSGQPRESEIPPPTNDAVNELPSHPPRGDNEPQILVEPRESLLKRIGEAIAKQPHNDTPVDEKRLEELIGQIRKDYESRTARIRARSALPRKPLHGDGEPGNAWDFYRKALDEIRTMTIDERSVLDSLSDEKGLNRLSKDNRLALELRGKEIAEKYRPILEDALRGTRQIRADREALHPEGSPRDVLSLMYSQYLQNFATQVIRTKSESGDLIGAMDILTNGILFSQDIVKDGTLIDNMISTAVQRSLITENLPRLLAREDLSSGLMDDLSRDMGLLVDNQISFLDTLDVETTEMEFLILQGLTGDWKDFNAMYGLGKNANEVKEFFKSDNLLRQKTIVAEGMIETAKHSDSIRGQADLLGTSYPDFRAFVQSTERSVGEGNPISKIIVMTINTPPMFDLVVRNRATLEGAQIAVAIKRYRLQQGAFPARVEDLYSRGYLPALPKDPFTGEGWKYAVAPDGLSVTVWSVGPNFRDDGGIETAARKRMTFRLRYDEREEENEDEKSL